MKTLNSQVSFRRVLHTIGVASASLSALGLIVSPTILMASKVEAAPFDKLEAKLFLTQSTYKKGEPIPVSLSLSNKSSQKLKINFPSGQRYDFKVFRQGEANPVYVWSADKLFITQTGSIEIGENRTQPFFDKIPTGNLDPGKYRLEGMFTSNPLIVANPVNFEIKGQSNQGAPVEDLKVKIKLDKKNYALNEPVKIDFALKNPTNKQTTVNFQSYQYDIVVRNDDGDIVWNWAANKKFLLKVLPLTLDPGQEQTYTQTWNQEVFPNKKGVAQIKPGNYTVNVFFQTQPRLKGEPITIKIQ